MLPYNFVNSMQDIVVVPSCLEISRTQGLLIGITAVTLTG